MTPHVCGDDMRQEVKRKDDKQTMSESRCEFIGVRRWCLGDDGGHGWWGMRCGRVTCSPACSPPPAPAALLKRSNGVINGQRLQISRRVCGVEKSQRRKHGKGRKTRREFCLQEKYNPLSLFYCAGRDQTALCYDLALWVILSSG